MNHKLKICKIQILGTCIAILDKEVKDNNNKQLMKWFQI